MVVVVVVSFCGREVVVVVVVSLRGGGEEDEKEIQPDSNVDAKSSTLNFLRMDVFTPGGNSMLPRFQRSMLSHLPRLREVSYARANAEEKWEGEGGKGRVKDSALV
jgi:hypothetical protein